MLFSDPAKSRGRDLAVDDGQPPSLRSTVIVDPAAKGVADPSSVLVGRGWPLSRARLIYAIALGAGVQKQARYYPDHPAGETCSFGLDFSAIIPFGGGLKSGTLAIQTNTATPTDAHADWTIGSVEVRGRSLFAILGGGVPGVDYRLLWTAYDTAGNVWPRVGLCLCADTS